VALHVPRDWIISELGVADDIGAALMRHEGELGRLLSLAEHVEQADQDSAAHVLQQCRHIGLNDLTWAELEAMAWVNEITAAAS
jgi:c-di-GMP-related signal transduction protein